MPFGVQQSNDLLKPNEDMAFNLELKETRSKEQRSSSKIARERFDLPKSINGVGPPCRDLSHRVRQYADSKIFVQPTRNRSWQRAKGSTTKSGELVKHMTNLPDYLLQADRGENIQENPLNFGVLDWSQLEKWKHKQKRTPAKARNFTSFDDGESSSRKATNSSSAASIETSNKAGLSEGAKPYFQNVKRSQHFETGDKRKNLDKSVSGVRTFASYLRDGESSSRKATNSSSAANIETSNKEGLSEGDKPYFQNVKRSQHFETGEKRDKLDKSVSGVRTFASYLRDSETEKSMEGLQEFNVKIKERNHEFATDMGLPSSKFKSKGVSVRSKKKISSRSNKSMIKDDQLQESDDDAVHKCGQSKPSNIVLLRPREISSTRRKTVIKDDQLQESDIDANHIQGHSKPNNILLLHPREISQVSSPDIFETSRIRTSFDEILAESSSSLSNVSLLEDINSEDVCSEIPHPSEQNSMVEPAPNLEAMLLRTDTDQGTDYSSVASETSPFSIKSSSLQSECAYFEKNSLDNKLTSQCNLSNLKESLDQESAELTGKRGRNLSSSHRFSFSLSRIGRSFSFKEGSTLPQFSSMYVSAKSGPVTSVSSARWYSSSKEKENGHNRSRSSPLRRLLDPILKHKASKVRHSAENNQEQKESLDSISFRTTSACESLADEISEGSSIQAFLLVTIKNGQPFFKFVLNNETKVLVAALRSLEPPEKDDSSCYFTFYLLNEIKKKSGGWMSHGSKEKGCGYVYNVVGQMKFSSSTVTEPSNQNSKMPSVLKEYVLLGVEIDQTDEGPPKVIQSQELAAAVVKIPCKNLIHKGLHWDNNLSNGCLKCLAEDRCMCNSGENDVLGNTTVILPGGIHGSSAKGEPSPLIHRWKSGGLCDCGGWDVGCKLLVLSNQKQSSKSHPERFQLFVQEGAEQDSPSFTLVPLKDGVYSVEFISSITHLQAFFISVAALSRQKLSSSLEMTGMQEEIFMEPGTLKNSNNFLEKAAVNYTPIPPPSPAGRV